MEWYWWALLILGLFLVLWPFKNRRLPGDGSQKRQRLRRGLVRSLSVGRLQAHAQRLRQGQPHSYVPGVLASFHERASRVGRQQALAPQGAEAVAQFTST